MELISSESISSFTLAHNRRVFKEFINFLVVYLMTLSISKPCRAYDKMINEYRTVYGMKIGGGS
jgi:hypothetical protein